MRKVLSIRIPMGTKNKYLDLILGLQDFYFCWFEWVRVDIIMRIPGRLWRDYKVSIPPVSNINPLLISRIIVWTSVFYHNPPLSHILPPDYINIRHKIENYDYVIYGKNSINPIFKRSSPQFLWLPPTLIFTSRKYNDYEG